MERGEGDAAGAAGWDVGDMVRLAPGLKPKSGGDGSPTPTNLLAVAVSYAGAADTLNQTFSNAHIPAFYLLTGFSLELSLKAFLLHRTKDAVEVESLRHDLSKIWARAKELGFDTSLSTISATDFDWMIAAIAPHHKAHTFRYLPDVQPFVATIAPPDLVKGAAAMCALVNRHIDIIRL